jgi:hypothetical protein
VKYCPLQPRSPRLAASSSEASPAPRVHSAPGGLRRASRFVHSVEEVSRFFRRRRRLCSKHISSMGPRARPATGSCGDETAHGMRLAWRMDMGRRSASLCRALMTASRDVSRLRQSTRHRSRSALRPLLHTLSYPTTALSGRPVLRACLQHEHVRLHVDLSFFDHPHSFLSVNWYTIVTASTLAPPKPVPRGLGRSPFWYSPKINARCAKELRRCIATGQQWNRG